MMKSQRKTVFLAAVILIGLLCHAQTPRRVKVIIDNASLRIRPSLEAEILDVTSKGTIFDVVEKAGPWYTIVFSVDQSGKAVYGYIHESMVTPLETAEGKKEVVEKPELHPAQLEKETYAQKAATPAKRVLSGTSLKYGFGDHWLASIGHDFGLHRNLALGFELQPYYNNYPELDLSIVEMNVFVNAKAGFRFSIFSLYGGGGIGPNLSYATTEIEGESFSQYESKLAYHVLAGTALNLNSIAIIFEYQMIMISDPVVDPDSWAYFFLIGLKF